MLCGSKFINVYFSIYILEMFNNITATVNGLLVLLHCFCIVEEFNQMTIPIPTYMPITVVIAVGFAFVDDIIYNRWPEETKILTGTYNHTPIQLCRGNYLVYVESGRLLNLGSFN